MIFSKKQDISTLDIRKIFPLKAIFEKSQTTAFILALPVGNGQKEKLI